MKKQYILLIIAGCSLAMGSVFAMNNAKRKFSDDQTEQNKKQRTSPSQQSDTVTDVVPFQELGNTITLAVQKVVVEQVAKEKAKLQKKLDELQETQKRQDAERLSTIAQLEKTSNSLQGEFQAKLKKLEEGYQQQRNTQEVKINELEQFKIKLQEGIKQSIEVNEQSSDIIKKLQEYNAKLQKIADSLLAQKIEGMRATHKQFFDLTNLTSPSPKKYEDSVEIKELQKLKDTLKSCVVDQRPSSENITTSESEAVSTSLAVVVSVPKTKASEKVISANTFSPSQTGVQTARTKQIKDIGTIKKSFEDICTDYTNKNDQKFLDKSHNLFLNMQLHQIAGLYKVITDEQKICLFKAIQSVKTECPQQFAKICDVFEDRLKDDDIKNAINNNN